MSTIMGSPIHYEIPKFAVKDACAHFGPFYDFLCIATFYKLGHRPSDSPFRKVNEAINCLQSHQTLDKCLDPNCW